MILVRLNLATGTFGALLVVSTIYTILTGYDLLLQEISIFGDSTHTAYRAAITEIID
jgi:hypothetical protein